MALQIIDDLVKTKVANGKTEKEAKSSLRSSMTSYWKPIYKEAYKSGKTSEMARIRKILYSSGLYGNADEVVKSVSAWLKD
jgi:geranylgeranyl pyrophosphate synthase